MVDGERLLEAARAAVMQGRLGLAYAVADDGLRRGLRHPLMFKLRAAKLQAEGRFAEAATDFESALAQAPDDFAALNGMGLCLARLGRVTEALAALNQAVALQPDYAPARFNQGWTLERLGRLRDAEAAYAETLALDPSHLTAKASLAMLKARRAERGEATRLAQEILQIDADHPVAGLAQATVHLQAGEWREAEASLSRLLASSRVDAHERSVATGLLADSLDGQERYREAFAAYGEANHALLEAYTAEAGQAAMNAYEFVGHLRSESSALASGVFQGRKPKPAQGPVHVFIVGFPRSGTTLVGQILNAHPDIQTLDERENLVDSARRFLTSRGGLTRFAELDEDALEPLRNLYWLRVRQAGVEIDRRVFVDKLPMNTLGLPLIARLFPSSRIVFMQRDPRDVVLSCFRQRFVMNATNAEFTTLEGAARFYDAVMSLAELYTARLDLAIRRQSLEDLILHFEDHARELCDFVDVGWLPTLADFGGAARLGATATPSSARLAQGLDAQGMGRWRNYAPELEGVLPCLAPWIARFGYEADGHG